MGVPGAHSGFDWVDGRRPQKSGRCSTATFDWRRFISYENGKSAVSVKNARPGAQLPVRLQQTMQDVASWQSVIAAHSESVGMFEKLRAVSPEQICSSLGFPRPVLSVISRIPEKEKSVVVVQSDAK